VLGALGIVYSIHVYVGAESYRFMRGVTKGKPTAQANFYGTMRGVEVEFVPASEQTAPDRELLAAFGPPAKRGDRGPIFRAYRPGYIPWHITEEEGKLLADCLRGILALCTGGVEVGPVDFWEKEDVFPFLVPDRDDASRRRYNIRLVEAPEPPTVRPKAAAVDEAQVNDILRRKFLQQGFLEVDHFFAMAEIGKKNERKACLSAAIVCDGESGFALESELGEPGEPVGELLVRVILGAIRKARAVPREIHVRKQEFKFMLEVVSAQLGFAVHVRKTLPMADPFKEGLLAHVGDPGDLPTE
jgi:hypothetical protein